MHKKLIYSLLSTTLCLGLLSCEKKSESSATNVAVNADSAVAQVPVKPAATSISFKESSFDFGKVNEGDKVEHTFTFTNTGEHPLVISNANASCGCTLPEWTKDPVMPGKEGKIRVKYDSAGKEGKINKTVTVLANTEPEATVLNILVEVIKNDASQGPLKK